MLYDEIRMIREKTGMTRKEFAKKLGITEIYVGSLERIPPRGSRLFMPSIELLKKIARIGASNDEERKFFERKLLFEKMKLAAPKEIKSFFNERREKEEELLMERGMPLEFIDRLKKDIEEFGEIDGNFYEKTGLNEEQMNRLIEGKYFLNRKKVISLATALGQPVEEYLIIADYIPDALRNVVSSNKRFALFRKLTSLPEKDIDEMIDVFDRIFKICKGDAKDGGP